MRRISESGEGESIAPTGTSGILFDRSDTQESAYKKLDVSFARLIKQEQLSWPELFEGFERLRAITYSSSASFIRDLFGQLKAIEVIFGSDVSVPGDIARLFAAQEAGVEPIRNELSRAGKELAHLVKEERLHLFYARYTVHRKMFILEGSGRRRLILGSANLSHAAFGGLQGEHLVVFDDDDAYRMALQIYESHLKDSDPILPQFWEKAGPVDVEELPAFSEIIRRREALLIEPSKLGATGSSPSSSDVTTCLIKTEDYRRHYANTLPPVVGRPVLIAVDHIRKVREQVRQIGVAKGVERREIPNLQADPERGEVRLNGRALDLAPRDAEVISDAQLIEEFMRGYRRYFIGKVDELVQDYSAFMTWFFAAPFIYLARTAALQNECNALRYPACGVLYGKSNAGKTDLTKVLLRAMFGQEWWLDSRDFTQTNFYGAAERGGSFPIVIDDISPDKFRDAAKPLIKRDSQTGHFPVLVLSTNQDVRAVEPEILKRAVVIHADASTPIVMNAANNFVGRVNRRLGTSFYRRYLNRMLCAWPSFIAEFQSLETAQEATVGSGNAADLMKLSNSTLRAVLEEALGATPDWYPRIDVSTLTTMNGRKVKDKMRSQWEFKPTSFRVDRAANLLIMTISDQRDRNDFRKDVPSHVYSDTREDKVIMLLSEAEEFFGIRFSRSRIKRFLATLGIA
jgi:hypothetical protein